MSSKRPHSEVDAHSSANSAAANKKRKHGKSHKPRENNSNHTGAPAGTSLNDTKKRARDIERRFARGDQLPADVRQNLERELAHCKVQIEHLQHKKKRNDMISKYHKVRFFERQKAERLRKQLQKRLAKADDPEEKASIEKQFHIADVDWYYAKYFPFMEPYISLYPKAKEESGHDDEPIAKRALHVERPPVWKEIEDAMESGERALEAIQERRPEKTGAADPVPKAKKALPNAPPHKDKFDGMSQERRLRLRRPEAENVPAKPAKNRRERRKEQRLQEEHKKAAEEAADESDGSGFFDA